MYFVLAGKQGVSVSIPTIITPAKVVTVQQTNIASLPCKAVGLPVPELSWGRVFGSLPSGRHVIHGNGTLVIKRTLLKDAGMYVCQAKNILGISKSTTVLNVHGKITLLITVCLMVVQLISLKKKPFLGTAFTCEMLSNVKFPVFL